MNLVTPSTDTLWSSSGHHYGYSGGGGIPFHLTLNPGDTLETVFDAQLVWVTWDTTGHYELLLRHYDDGSGLLSTIAVETFEVTAPAGIDSSSFAITQEAVSRAFHGWGITDQTESQLDSLSGVTSFPAHMREFLKFAYAVSAFSRSGRAESSESVSRYDDFKSEYPSSSYQDGRSLIDFLLGGNGEVPVDGYSEFGIRLNLEGAYSSSGDSMVSTLTASGYTPLAESYNIDPWFHESYPPSDATPYGPLASDLVDWVLVGLYDESLDSVVDMVAGLVNTSGWTYPSFVNLPLGEYRVIVDHRNHVAIASDTLVDFTSGYAEHDFTTGHAYSEGPNPQKEVPSSGSGVFAMFAGDEDANCQITVGDFAQWLVDTKAAETGYVDTDFDMDANVTVTDFSKWLVNTKAAAGCAFPYEEWDYPGPQAATYWTGGSSEALPKAAIGQATDVLYRVAGDPHWEPNGYVNHRIYLKTDPGDTDTLGVGTFDVYFNSDQIYYAWPIHTQELLDAGYTLEINEGVNEHGSFVRAQVYTWHPDTVRYTFGDDWYHLFSLRFYENNGQITEHGVAMNLATLEVVLISDGVFEEPDAIVPEFRDVFQY